jgi:hypothetical protein
MVPVGFAEPGGASGGVTATVVKALIFVTDPAMVTMFLNIQK